MVHGVRAIVLGVKAELKLEQGTGISLSLMKEVKIPTAWPGTDFWEPLHMRSGSAGMTTWTDPPKEIPKIQQVTQRAGTLCQSNEDSGRISAFLRSWLVFWEEGFPCTDTKHNDPKHCLAKTPWNLSQIPPERCSKQRVKR